MRSRSPRLETLNPALASARAISAEAASLPSISPIKSARRRTPVMNRLHGLWSLGGVTGGIATVLVNRADISVQVHLAVVTVALLAVSLFVVPAFYVWIDNGAERVKKFMRRTRVADAPQVSTESA